MAKQKQTIASENIPAGAFDQALLAWVAPSHLRYERGWLWFAVLFLSCAGLVTYAYTIDSITMMVLFVVLPLVLLLEHRKAPAAFPVVVSPYGIRFGELRIPYSHIRRFWILHNPPFIDELHLLTDSRLHPEVTIQLMGTDATLLRQYLVTQVLEWEGKSISTVDLLVRLLRLA